MGEGGEGLRVFGSSLGLPVWASGLGFGVLHFALRQCWAEGRPLREAFVIISSIVLLITTDG